MRPVGRFTNKGSKDKAANAAGWFVVSKPRLCSQWLKRSSLVTLPSRSLLGGAELWNEIRDFPGWKQLPSSAVFQFKYMQKTLGNSKNISLFTLGINVKRQRWQYSRTVFHVDSRYSGFRPYFPLHNRKSLKQTSTVYFRPPGAEIMINSHVSH